MDALLDSIDLHNATTAQLVPLASDGDRTAQGELVRRFQASVYGLAMRRLNNHAEAQELCQEVFVQALEKLHQLRAREAFASWLRRIAVRMAVNRLTRRGPLPTGRWAVIDATESNMPSPLEGALERERRDQVRDGLDRLGEMDRQTLVAFYVNGKSLAEMSDEHRAPVGTIKRRLHVARKRLAKELQSLAV